MQTINIHLADDHQILIDGIKTLLSTIPGFSVVGTSLNGTTIYEEVVQNKADVLVLDISMPEKDGIQVLKEFSKKGFPLSVQEKKSLNNSDISFDCISFKFK